MTGDLLVVNAGQAATPAEGGGVAVVQDAAILVRGGRIHWWGPQSECPVPLPPDRGKPVARVDARGGVVLPGLVECHTHLLFAGHRVAEVSLRLRGEPYGAILAQGGGILSTVRQTRAASDEELTVLGRNRLESLLHRGVTTCEVKSGYGLDTGHELRLLRVARGLAADPRWDLVPTFLGAHAVPPERRSDRSRYVDELVQDMLPQVASQGLARYCDVFCEREAFSVPESRRILLAARDLGLGTRIHAEQITRSGASQLAAEVGARSADHLEKVSHEDVEALAAAGVIGVLLPGASLVLRTPPAPARQLIDGGVTVALSTDWNPGTCPSPDLPLMAALGCYHLGMTAEEALAGITWSAARALGLGEDRGRLRVGDRGDLSIHAVADWREMVFGLGQRTCVAAVKDGTVAWQRGDRAL